MPYKQVCKPVFVPRYKLVDSRYIEFQDEPYWSGDEKEMLVNAIPYYMGECRSVEHLIVLKLVDLEGIKYKRVSIDLFIE